MLNKPLNRRAALSFIGGAIAGATIDSAINMVDRPTVPLAGNEKAPESCANGQAAERFEAHIDTYVKKRAADHAITKRRAQSESSPGSGISKYDFTKRAVYASKVLPDMLKGLICYIPFEESKYNTSAVSDSNPPAVGTWQFMPGTAANPDKVGPYIMVNQDDDRRMNFELSTKAAVKYFEYIFKLLSASSHYQTLKLRYGLDDNGLLSLAVIHAYNAGEGHMLRAFEVMANEPEVRASVDLCGKNGDLDLYLYLTEEYSREPQKWQTIKPYFYKISSAYAYKVMAFQKLDNPKSNFKPPIAKMPTPPQAPEKISKISTGARAAIASVGTLVAWGSAEHSLGKITKTKPVLDRRTFVTGLGLMAGAATGAAISHKVRDKIKDLVPTIPSIDVPEQDKPEIKPLATLDAKTIAANPAILQAVYRHTQNAEFIKNHQDQQITVKNISQLPYSQKYAENLQMADASYELYQTHSKTFYLQFAKFFYDQSLSLCQQQIKGKLPKPGKTKSEGDNILNERQNYLLSALKVINAEFTNNN